MADFYFISNIINTIWQIFTMLFLLYKFTTFFSSVYNFGKFLNKLLKGCLYIKDQIQLYITKRINYSIDNEHINFPTRPKSFFSMFKDKCYNIYNKVFNVDNTTNNTNTTLPLYETRTSLLNLNNELNESIESEFPIESSINFIKYINNNSQNSYENSDYLNMSRMNYKKVSSNEPPSENEHCKLNDSELNEQYNNELNEELNEQSETDSQFYSTFGFSLKDQ